jgi:sphingolipid 4-desaturase/C4-monooxygenase
MGRSLASAADAADASRRDFFFSSTDEPHVTRRAEILKKHPEIKSLMGPEYKTKYIVAATVALQVFMAWLTLEWRWPAYLIAVYVVGATANHSLFLAIHELAHNLGAHSIMGNKLIGFLANMPIGIPYAVTFKPYHMEHHRYQGRDGVDTDVPTRLEGYLLTDSSFGYIDRTIRKAIFMFFQIFAYALRPLFVKPANVPYGGYLVANYVAQFSFDGLMAYLFGWQVLIYFILSTFFAGSIHPTAGHFIAEHYVMEGTTETYSYYGPLNRLTYNVGYHNEHHDFPNIAWSSLPKVREIAPEFYDHLPRCNSWPGALFRYIFDDSISPYSRVKRAAKQE